MNPCGDCIHYDENEAICGFCKQNGYPFQLPLEEHSKTIPEPVITNYDRIISMTPKELAAWIAEHPVIVDYDENNSQHRRWLDWLRQEVKP